MDANYIQNVIDDLMDETENEFDGDAYKQLESKGIPVGDLQMVIETNLGDDLACMREVIEAGGAKDYARSCVFLGFELGYEIARREKDND